MLRHITFTLPSLLMLPPAASAHAIIVEDASGLSVPHLHLDEPYFTAAIVGLATLALLAAGRALWLLTATRQKRLAQ